MTAPADRWDVFLAHATEDVAEADELYAALRARHPALRVFLATRSLFPGERWSREIPRALDATLVTVVLFSSRATDEWYRGAEIADAIRDLGDGRVVPVRLDGGAKRAPYGLANVVAIDAADVGTDAVADRVAAVVARVCARTGAATAPTPAMSPHDRAALEAWLAFGLRRHAYVRIVGFQSNSRVRLPIDRIYVPLRIDGSTSRNASAPSSRHGDEHLAEEQGVTIDRALQLAHERGKGLALLGYPGAGKTTILRHLFWRAAGKQLAGVPHLEGLHPVLLRLADVQDAEIRGRGLRDCVARAAESDRNPDAAVPYRAPLPPPTLFLLDGLDEIGDHGAADRLCRWLVRELDHWPGSVFVVTTRPGAWERSRLSESFQPAWLQGLAPEDVVTYVRQWFAEVEGALRPLAEPPELARERAAAKAADLLAVLEDARRQGKTSATGRALDEMTANPLMLSTICLVHHSRRHLPRQRAELYGIALQLLLEDWAAERALDDAAPAPARRVQLKATDASLVLRPLAYAMHAGAQGGDGPTSLSRDAAAELIRRPLADVPALRDAGLTAETFLDVVRDDCGLLVAREAGQLQFIHLQFQEYLAACHVADERLEAELAARAGEPRWEEVILLAMSIPSVFRPFMDAVLARSDVVALEPLLRRCLEEAPRISAAPFEAAADRALAIIRGGDPAAAADASAMLRLLFGLARDRELPGMVDRARSLGDRGGLELRLAARLLVGLPALSVGLGWNPGHPMVEPTTKMSLLWIPPGRFMMGSSKQPGEPNFDAEAFANELPVHPVTITRGYWMGEHPVTNEQYRAFVVATGHRSPPSFADRRFNDPLQPVVAVACADARAFCAWLSKLLAPQGVVARLPTEAEWEYAARGTDGRKYPWGSSQPTAALATFGLDADTGQPSTVGQHPDGRSASGIHDMAGNVWEWCRDGWRDSYAGDDEEIDPCNPEGEPDGDPAATALVIRGGCWTYGANSLRCACRMANTQSTTDKDQGFRVVCVVAREG